MTTQQVARPARSAASGALGAMALWSALAAANPLYLVGQDVDGGGVRIVYNNGNTDDFHPYGTGFLGGVRVASGDVNRDGVPDIIVAPGSGTPQVMRFDGFTGLPIDEFPAYPPAFTGGVYIAAGDIDADGITDIVTGAGAGGGPHVKVFSGATGTELHSFFAYGSTFTGGVRVAAGDVNADGRADIITGAGPGAGPHIKVFDGRDGAVLHDFFAYDPGFTGGVFVGSGDFDGDGFADIITGVDAGAGPHVKVFEGERLDVVCNFFAFSPTFTGGVRVALGDVNGDGLSDLVVGTGAGVPGQVSQFLAPAASTGDSNFPFGSYAGGVFVAGVAALPTVFRSGFEAQPLPQ